MTTPQTGSTPTGSRIADLDQIPNECKMLMTTRSLMSAGATVVPLPGADIVADIGLLATLMPEISRRFGLDHG